MMVSAVLASMPLLAAPRPVEVDFEEVEISAHSIGPALTLISDRTSSLCPRIDPSSTEYQECVLNLDYATILRICHDLGESTHAVTDAMFRTELYKSPLFASQSAEEVWNGCIFNAVSGPRVQSFVWTSVEGKWLMTNAPTLYTTARSQGSVNAFDDFGVGSGETGGRVLESQYSMAYILDAVPHQASTWVARVSKLSQEAINAALEDEGVAAPYCSSAHHDSECAQLPRLIIRAAGPNVLAVRSVGGEETVRISGVLFRAMTSFSYTSRGSAPHGELR